ncbi:TonB-dependent receptor plug domain-containing protein [Pleionea sediminis]|uniref:TonB-dependent receptor plug domain-containing protein n=1 Tax=Pleionea sediminis TaxID=2569479 RepID=UPI001FEAD956|nr:TonB-dependent receptor [Pleionea sediminis]
MKPGEWTAKHLVCSLLLCAFLDLSAEDSGNSTVDDDSLMNMTLDQLLTIKVTSVTKTQVKVKDAPAVISIVTSEDIENYQFSSVAELLGSQPGFDSLDHLGFYNVGVRGVSPGLAGNSLGIKAMIDEQDMAFRTTASSQLGPEFIPDIMINRVEAIRGPLSVIYGANAFLGTINVVPKTWRHFERQERAFQMKHSAVYEDSQLGYRSQFSFGDVFDNGGFAAALAISGFDHPKRNLPQTSPRFDIFAAGDNTHSQIQENKDVSLYANTDFETAVGLFKLDTSYQSFRKSAQFHPDSEPLFPGIIAQDNRMVRLRHSYELNEQWQIKSSLALNSGQSGNETRNYDPFRIGINYAYRDYSFDYTTSSLTFVYSGIARFNWLLGVDYAFDDEELPTLILIDSGGDREERNAGRNIEVDNLGLFTQLDYSFEENSSFVAGVRVDDYSIYDEQVSYRVGLVHDYSNSTVLKLLRGRSFQAPSIMLMFGGEHPRLLGPADNSQLKPQRAVTNELSISHQFDQSMQTEATLFNTKIENFAEYDIIASNPVASNRAQISTRGFELALKFSFLEPQLKGYFQYTWHDTKVSSGQSFGIDISNEPRLFAEYLMSAGIYYQWSAIPLSGFLSLERIGDRIADNSNLPFLPLGNQTEYVLPAYTVSNVGLSWELPWFKARTSWIKFKIDNIFDKEFIEPGFSGIDVPGKGRTLTLTYQQSF